MSNTADKWGTYTGFAIVIKIHYLLLFKINIKITVPTGLGKSIPEWRDIALKQTPNDRAVDFGHYIVATNAT
ncbi:MAG: hypothetical protein LBM93_11735, partial [Oscillospiraceae bacterium]|nr:hypothetical protein [Oscillospiraceae bacterium]